MAERSELNSLGVNPGQLRHRITLLEPVSSVDAGGTVTTFMAGAKAWARIRTIRTEEVIRMGLDTTQTYQEVVIRYSPLFTADKRIRTNKGTIYAIQGVENVLENDSYLVLRCIGIGANN